MEAKKNPSIDPKRNSLLYFQIGLLGITILTYLAIELKTMDPVFKEEKLEIVEFTDDDEIIPLTQQVQKLPPPPPPAPEVIQVVDDKVVIEDKPIETTETDEKKEVVVVKASEVGDADGEEIDDSIIPFATLEDYPVFPGCEGVAKADRFKCFQEQILKFINKNQQYPERAVEDEIEGRIFVNFVIGKDGVFTVQNVRGTGKNGSDILEKEAMRVMSKMPKIQPGKQRGKPVRVGYSIPITFKLQR